MCNLKQLSSSSRPTTFTHRQQRHLAATRAHNRLRSHGRFKVRRVTSRWQQSKRQLNNENVSLQLLKRFYIEKIIELKRFF